MASGCFICVSSSYQRFGKPIGPVF
jgi:hypothetical protein